jgi:hypothetical protein
MKARLPVFAPEVALQVVQLACERPARCGTLFSQGERVLRVDEQTNLQPRPCLAATLSPRPGSPVRLEHEDKRGEPCLCLRHALPVAGRSPLAQHGASGRRECMAFLTQLQRELASSVTRLHLVLDTASIPKRLRSSDFSGVDQLAERLMITISEGNAQAPPFNWSTRSEALVMARCEASAVSIPTA